MVAFSCRGTPKSQSFQTSVPMALKAKGPAAEAQPFFIDVGSKALAKSIQNIVRLRGPLAFKPIGTEV